MITKRSNTYRKKFFAYREPDWRGKYFCIYCGCLLRPDQVSVDHIVPVKAAQTSKAVRKRLQNLGVSDINSVENLGAACRRCNSKKGSRQGGWVWRGKLGKTPGFWLIRWKVRIITTTFLLFYSLAHTLIKRWH